MRSAIVVGMARSGTSLAAGTFARKGYFVGGIARRARREGDDSNPFGYFEADDLVERNVAVLRRAGYRFHNTWLYPSVPGEVADRLYELEATAEDRAWVASYEQQAPWLWKDPRLCHTLGYWWRLLDPARTGVLVVEREPADVFRSFCRRGWCTNDAASRQRIEELVAAHRRAVEIAIQRFAIPHVSIAYREYLTEPGSVARRLSAFFEGRFEPWELNVRPELNHASVRGRLSSRLRRAAARPMPVLRWLRRHFPDRVIFAMFPEKRYTHGKPVEEEPRGR